MEDIRNQFINLMTQNGMLNPDEEFDLWLVHLSATELCLLGKVFLDLAEWKLSYRAETPGVTPRNQDGAGNLGAELPGCNSVSEFPAAPKMPFLALAKG